MRHDSSGQIGISRCVLRLAIGNFFGHHAIDSIEVSSVSRAAKRILEAAGCAFCGFAVGIMWPGSISISSKSLPGGGTAMFAFLALAGDLGAMVSPAMVGKLAETTGGNLKAGLLAATAFPIVLVCGLLIARRKLHSSI